MGNALTVSCEIAGNDELRKLQAFLAPATYGRAVREGVRYGAASAKPAAAKAIGSRYNLKAARIKKDILKPYIKGATAEIIFRRTPPSLMSFGAKPGTRGHQRGMGRGKGWAKASPRGKSFTFKILRGGRRISAPDVFVANFTKKDGEGFSVALRRSRKGKLGYAGSGPSIGSIFAGKSKFGDSIREEVLARIGEQFEVGFKRSLDKQRAGY